MAKKQVADLLVETLAAARVESVYGIAGDSLNGITDSIRRLLGSNVSFRYRLYVR